MNEERAGSVGTGRRPNLLLVVTDQQFAGSIGCYGSRLCATPNIDRLAAEGVRFSGAYCACPICTPARASMQTGLYPFKNGMQTNIYTRGCMVHELPDHPSLLSRLLQSCGYRTGFTGKWHLGFGDDRESHPEYQEHVRAVPVLDWFSQRGCVPSTVGYEGDDFPGHGGIGMATPQYREYLRRKGIELKKRVVFDHYPDTFELLSGPESSVSYFLTENAIEQMGRFIDAGAPFFYALNFWGPHAPYHAPKEYVDRYRDTPIPPWPSFEEDQSTKPTIHNAHRTERTRHWTWQEFETALRVYYASVTEIDDQLGRISDFLKARGEYDNTLILFTSDHGESIGVHRGLTDKSIFMYEEITRVPLIIKEPGKALRAGETEDRFAGTCDLYSTVLDYAGVDREVAERDGRSLRPLLEGKTVQWRDCIVTEASGIDYLQYTQRAIRYQHYKYVFNCGDTDELYDLQQDPHELKNLAVQADHAELLHTLRLKLEAWMVEMNDGLVERYRRLRNLC